MYMNSVSKEKKTKKEQWEERENAYFIDKPIFLSQLQKLLRQLLPLSL